MRTQYRVSYTQANGKEGFLLSPKPLSTKKLQDLLNKGREDKVIIDRCQSMRIDWSFCGR